MLINHILTVFRFTIAFSALPYANADFKIVTDDEAGTVTVLDKGIPIATYSYRDERVRRPYFAHVKAPNGIQVTRNWPPVEGVDPTDHDTIHPGIWMAFGNINGGDFWRNKGLVRHNRFIQLPRASSNAVRFVVENEYIHKGKTYTVERAEHTIQRSDNGYLFLFDSRFRAIGRLDFGDQQEMGLGIRLATPLMVKNGTGRILNSEGHLNEAEAWGKRALWTDYSGLIDGQRTGAMLMPDPRNFRPSRFHSRDYGFTAANPFGDAGFIGGKENHTIIGDGKRLHVNFGLLVYSLENEKPLDNEKVYQQFLNTLKLPGSPSGQPWKRHTIDAGSRGADGIRVGDINQDGYPDLTTGWEEGGQVRVTLNPGPDSAKKNWKAVVVGQVPAPEDAVFADLDGNGILDVVSCTEGQERTVFAHFAPDHLDGLAHPNSWSTLPFTHTKDVSQWMFALPLSFSGQKGDDLIIGSKGTDGTLGRLSGSGNRRDANSWKWEPWVDVGWIMSIQKHDMDGDGDFDVLYSDRCGAEAGIWWLENPGLSGSDKGAWRRHFIAGTDREVMFLDTGDLDGDGFDDIVAAARGDDFIVAYRESTGKPTWREERIPYPTGTGTGKAVAISDVDGDGQNDLLVTCENAFDASGVFWMQKKKSSWLVHDISGYTEGVKFDRIEMLDLDADGDLDLITCEEHHNLGVIWYENPF